MKRKSFWIIQLLVVVGSSSPLFVRAQNLLVPKPVETVMSNPNITGLPFLNYSDDPEAGGRGDTYFGATPTAMSGQVFSANLTWLYDETSDYPVPTNEFDFSDHNLNGGSLKAFSFTHAGSYDHGGGNAFTFYARIFNGGSGAVPYLNGNDASDKVVGAGLARSIDDNGFWSTGFNLNLICATQLPNLIKDQGDEDKYTYANATYGAMSFSIAYNGKDPYKSMYSTFGAALDNVGTEFTADQNYKKTFLPIDGVIGESLVKVFPSGDQLSWPVNIHLSEVFSLNTGLEYNINFNQTNKNGIDLRGGFIWDGNDKRYSGLTWGLGLRLKEFSLNLAHFITPSVVGGPMGTPIGGTTTLGIAFNIVKGTF